MAYCETGYKHYSKLPRILFKAAKLRPTQTKTASIKLSKPIWMELTNSSPIYNSSPIFFRKAREAFLKMIDNSWMQVQLLDMFSILSFSTFPCSLARCCFIFSLRPRSDRLQWPLWCRASPLWSFLTSTRAVPAEKVTTFCLAVTDVNLRIFAHTLYLLKKLASWIIHLSTKQLQMFLPSFHISFFTFHFSILPASFHVLPCQKMTTHMSSATLD